MTVPTKTLAAADVMTTEPVSLLPHSPIRELALVLETNEISGVPVVDEQQHVVGVVSRTDLVHYLMSEHEGEIHESFQYDPVEEDWTITEAVAGDIDATVEQIMNPEPVTVTAETSVPVIARKMADESIHRVIVVNRHKRLIGIVTSLDVLGVFPQ